MVDQLTPSCKSDQKIGLNLRLKIWIRLRQTWQRTTYFLANRISAERKRLLAVSVDKDIIATEGKWLSFKWVNHD